MAIGFILCEADAAAAARRLARDQCDHMGRMFVHYFAILNDENSPNSI